MSTAKRAWRVLPIVLTITAMGTIARAQDSTPRTQEPAASAKPKPVNKYVVRGCLIGSTLTDLEPAPPPLKLPEKLQVSSTRTIRDQVKALSGHQVEVTGALFGVAGVEEGILIGDSAGAKVYLGGGDPNLGQDLAVNRSDSPTIRATMIKDVASACTHR
jgi:hypothetical protein